MFPNAKEHLWKVTTMMLSPVQVFPMQYKILVGLGLPLFEPLWPANFSIGKNKKLKDMGKVE